MATGPARGSVTGTRPARSPAVSTDSSRTAATAGSPSTRSTATTAADMTVAVGEIVDGVLDRADRLASTPPTSVYVGPCTSRALAIAPVGLLASVHGNSRGLAKASPVSPAARQNSIDSSTSGRWRSPRTGRRRASRPRELVRRPAGQVGAGPRASWSSSPHAAPISSAELSPPKAYRAVHRPAHLRRRTRHGDDVDRQRGVDAPRRRHSAGSRPLQRDHRQRRLDRRRRAHAVAECSLQRGDRRPAVSRTSSPRPPPRQHRTEACPSRGR